jgi:hypothetical protein
VTISKTSTTVKTVGDGAWCVEPTSVPADCSGERDNRFLWSSARVTSRVAARGFITSVWFAVEYSRRPAMKRGVVRQKRIRDGEVGSSTAGSESRGRANALDMERCYCCLRCEEILSSLDKLTPFSR